MATRRQSYPDVADTPLARIFTRIYAIEESIHPGTRYPPQRVRCFTLLLTVGGEARVRVGAQLVSHRPGSIVVLAQGTHIEETAGKGAPWHVRYLMVLGPWAAAITRLMTDRGEKVFV